MPAHLEQSAYWGPLDFLVDELENHDQYANYQHTISPSTNNRITASNLTSLQSLLDKSESTHSGETMTCTEIPSYRFTICVSRIVYLLGYLFQGLDHGMLLSMRVSYIYGLLCACNSSIDIRLKRVIITI